MPADRKEMLETLRADAHAIFLAGVAAADPAALVTRALRLGPQGGLRLGDGEIRPPGVLRIVAIGKAACPMAAAAAAALPKSIFPGAGIIVVNRENAQPVERFRVLATGHPLPDRAGTEAAVEVERHISGASGNDGLLVLLSGGGSAILPAPAAGLSLEEKVAVTELLLRSGADIGEVNTVRKHLSRLKGGGLARKAYPASVETLILSDVIGDDLSTIASGPTAPDPTSFEDAVDVLKRRGAWQRIPDAARKRLERGAAGEVPDTPEAGDPVFARVSNRILGSNTLSLAAAEQKAGELGYDVRVPSRQLIGEAREAAAFLASQCDREAIPHNRPGRRAILCGGETTVTVRGTGRGGRNQELALAFALAVEQQDDTSPDPWALLSGGTDGIDGPTDAAGALVDGGTLRRGRSAGFDPARALEQNDSYAFLDGAGDLLRTGATGTNVADLQILLM